MFKTLDIFKLSVAVSYSVFVALLLAYGVEIDPIIQDYAIVLTHLTAIPLVILIWNTRWIAWTILIGVIFSILFHISLVFEWYIERTDPMDICFANLTLMLITIVVVIERVPEWTLPILFTVNAINTAFWDTMWIYATLSALNNLLLTVYIIYRLCIPSKKRNATFLVIALTVGTIGTTFFLSDGGHNGVHYGILHSVWHVCSYTALYFALRSVNVKNDVLRRDRVEFDVKFENKIAYH